jgi:osmotically inducible protein OsmC
MTEFNRKAGVIWTGDLKSGSGLISTESRALFEEPYSYQTRFDNETGTNPEELLAAAYAACFSMALASTLKNNGFNPKKTDTNATCTVASKNGGHEITGMQLHVRVDVPDIDEATFQKLTVEAKQNCPVANVFREGLNVEIKTTLDYT